MAERSPRDQTTKPDPEGIPNLWSYPFEFHIQRGFPMAVSIAFVVLLGLFADYLFRKVKLPGPVGMLIVGILCGPYLLNLMESELLKVSADLRMVALIVILLRAGLELRRDTLNRAGRPAILLSFVPAVFDLPYRCTLWSCFSIFPLSIWRSRRYSYGW